MSRLQLALNVSDIDEAVAFYTALFDAVPAKRRPGYANFALADPPLKLVLIESAERAGELNHLGVEHASAERVREEADRLATTGLAVREEGDVVCCYARQDKHWVTGPDGRDWEGYVVLADAQPELEGRTTVADPASSCCGDGPETCCAPRSVGGSPGSADDCCADGCCSAGPPSVAR